MFLRMGSICAAILCIIMKVSGIIIVVHIVMFVLQRTDFDVHNAADDYHHKLPSLKLIPQLKGLSKMRKEHHKVQ